MTDAPTARRRARRIAGALVLATACAAATADSPSARTVEALLITSPSRTINCWAVQVRAGGPAVECMASYLKPIGELDPYLQLKARGTTHYGQRGDYDGYQHARRVVLRYGDQWTHAGVTCAMARQGLTCTNRAGHGFHLGKGDVRRF